ncbi:hypothetical protein MAP00_000329 [Monascus purpureus]|nr:hypothetical protein MAP00_000329 [Monascus purpureus]
MLYTRRMRILSPFFVLCGLAIFFYLYGDFPGPQSADNLSYTQQPSTQDKEFFWDQIPQRYPVQLPLPVPSVVPGSIAPIQHRFPPEESAARDLQMTRLQAVKGNFTHAWEGYKKYAWMSDEVAPLSGHAQNPFGGWAATLVDALDTLWIMGLYDEFEEAIKAVEKLDFTKCSLDEINVFETTIRFLGGFLGAYDISNQKYHVLLQKAVEVGSMLYAAFDTPNRMPVTRWKINAAAHGAPQEAGNNVLVAEIGSLTLEFTRLSQLTKDSRYFDAVQRIVDVFDAQQDQTKVPGLWPIIVDAKTMNFHAFTSFTIGGMADSLYEYLPKQYILLEGASQQYRKLYQKALTAMKAHIFFRPMAPGSENLLFPGDISSDGQIPLSQLKLEAKVQHLSCFAGGMVAIGAKAFNSPDDLTVARKLVEGCIWGYEHGY